MHPNCRTMGPRPFMNTKAFRHLLFPGMFCASANKSCLIKGRNVFALARESGAVKGESFEHNTSGRALKVWKKEGFGWHTRGMILWIVKCFIGMKSKCKKFTFLILISGLLCMIIPFNNKNALYLLLQLGSFVNMLILQLYFYYKLLYI